MTANKTNRAEVSIRKPLRGAEKGIISKSNSTGLQMKPLDLTGVIWMLPSVREGMRMNGNLVVISQTIHCTDLMLGVKRCFMYELADCVG